VIGLLLEIPQSSMVLEIGFGNGKMQALRKTKLQVAHPIQGEESNSSVKSYSGSGIRVAKYEGFD